MMISVQKALSDADIILFVTDIFEDGKKNKDTIEKIKNTKVPVLLLVNKIDLADQQKVEEKVAHWKLTVEKAEVIPVSALHKFNTSAVFDRILEKLPTAPPYFPKDQLTDKPERFFVAEIIREKVFKYYQKEIPYSVAVVVESFKEDEKIIRIRTEIIVDRQSQKGIIIGHQGKAIKKVGTSARKDIEKFLKKHVYLELFVKVSKDWRNNEDTLRMYGYNQ